MILRKLKTFLKLRDCSGYKVKGYPIVFLKNLRASGNSIQFAIEKHLEGFEDYSFKPRHKNKYKFFMVCRNPYTKMESSYFHFLKVGEYNMLHKSMSFDWFVKAQCSIPEDKRDGHTKTQSRFLKHNLKYNPHILRFENIEDDWKKFCLWKFNKELPLPHANKSNRTNAEIKWTEELKDIVYETYTPDFFNFDYAR